MASAGEAAFCQLSIENDVRLDGRSCLDMRPVELELGVIAQAAGSARLRMGATDVIVGVKVSALHCVGRGGAETSGRVATPNALPNPRLLPGMPGGSGFPVLFGSQRGPTPGDCGVLPVRISRLQGEQGLAPFAQGRVSLQVIPYTHSIAGSSRHVT
jgi:hypothetical protein